MTMTMMVGSYGSAGAGLNTRTRSYAASRDAQRLTELADEIREHLLSSIAVSRSAEHALSELNDVLVEAAEAGWNGYGAKPLQTEAYINAKRFLEALPTTAPVPEVSADQDGEISLDWIFERGKALSISIGANGRCSYAWIRGRRISRGTDWLDDEIPSSIVLALGQLVRDAAAKR
jgi:hypothetical protein